MQFQSFYRLIFNAGRAGVPDQRDPAAIPGIAHRDHRRATGPDQRPDNGTVRRLFGEKLLLPLCPLWEKVLPRVQGRSHGHPQAWNYAHQFPGTRNSPTIAGNPFRIPRALCPCTESRNSRYTERKRRIVVFRWNILFLVCNALSFFTLHSCTVRPFLRTTEFLLYSREQNTRKKYSS